MLRFGLRRLHKPPSSLPWSQAAAAQAPACARHLFAKGGMAPPKAAAVAEPVVEGEFVRVPKARFDELIEAEVAHLATFPEPPLSLNTILDNPDLPAMTKILLEQGPRRLAVRIRMIELLKGWQDVPELVQNHDMLHSWYRSLSMARTSDNYADIDMADLTRRVKGIRAAGRTGLILVSTGMYKLKVAHPNLYTDESLNKWADNFYLSRIGTNMLFDHFFALSPKRYGGDGKPGGLLEPDVDVAALVRDAATKTQDICKKVEGRAPGFTLQSYKEGNLGEMDTHKWDRQFSYIPGYLRYMLMEIFKNSYAATCKTATEPGQFDKRSRVSIRICRDDEWVAITIQDRAGGIPLKVGDRIWSYSYGAAAQCAESGEVAKPTPLSGYGVGLPVSRLYAKYLGGKLELASLPGYGTLVQIRLPRIHLQNEEGGVGVKIEEAPAQ